MTRAPIQPFNPRYEGMPLPFRTSNNPASSVLDRNVFHPLNSGLLFLAPRRSGLGSMNRRQLACNEGLGDWLNDTSQFLKSVPGVSVVANFGEKIGTWFAGPSPTVTTAANPTIKGVTNLSPVETKVAATYVNAANALNIKLPPSGYSGLSAADQYRLDQQAGRYVSVGSPTFWGPLQQQIASAVGGMSTSPPSPTSAPSMVTSPVKPAGTVSSIFDSILGLAQQAIPVVGQYYSQNLATSAAIKLQEAQAQSQIKTELQRQQAALALEEQKLALYNKYNPVTPVTPVQPGVVGAPYGGQFGVPMTSASTGTDLGSVFAALLLGRSGLDPAAAAASADQAKAEAPKVPESGSMMPMLLVGGLVIGAFFIFRKGGKRR